MDNSQNIINSYHLNIASVKIGDISMIVSIQWNSSISKSTLDSYKNSLKSLFPDGFEDYNAYKRRNKQERKMKKIMSNQYNVTTR
jgi:hypothetical protein